MSDEPQKSSETPPWSCLMILFILANFWWWFMFGSPFLVLFNRLIEAIEKIANM